MDYLLSKYGSQRERYYMIATTCLELAAKYDELDRNIPSAQEFLRAASAKLPLSKIEDLKECEIVCLRYLEWNLRVITPLIFVEVLLTQGVLHSSDNVNGKESVNPLVAKDVRAKALHCSNLALQCIIWLFNIINRL